MCHPLVVPIIMGITAAVSAGSAYVAYDEMKEAKHQQRQTDSRRAADKAALDKERRNIETQGTASMAKQLAAKKAARGGYGRRATMLTGSMNPNAGAKTLLGQ